MSLDIRVKKKIPKNNNVNPPTVEKRPVKIFTEYKKVNLTPVNSSTGIKKKSKNNIWWWLLFIILFLIFISVIYLIWRDNKLSTDVETSKTTEIRPGIVSNFSTTPVSEQVVPDNYSSDFDINLLTERVDQFDQIVSKVISDLAVSSTTSTINNQIVTSTPEINQLFGGLFTQAQELYSWLYNQVSLLKEKITENYNQNINTEIDDYLDNNNDYLSRIEGELQVVEAFLKLEENKNFTNEILLSFKNVNNYFKQVRNTTKLIEQYLLDNLSGNVATSTVTSTTTITNQN